MIWNTESPLWNADQITAVISSSMGIGAIIAKRLAQDCAFVVINYASNEQAAKEATDDQLHR